MALYCAVPRLEAALAEQPSFACPNLANCPSASPACRIFAPGWYCEEVDIVVLPALLRDCDDEPNGDDEPEDHD